MLVLTRRLEEEIHLTIGDKLIAVISVQNLRSDCVRIGIEAPDEVQISRPDMKKGPQALAEPPAEHTE